MIDPSMMNPAAIAARVLQATAHDEAMRLLATARAFDGYFNGRVYVVTFNDSTANDPMLVRAILLAARASGVQLPPSSSRLIGEEA